MKQKDVTHRKGIYTKQGLTHYSMRFISLLLKRANIYQCRILISHLSDKIQAYEQKQVNKGEKR